MGRDHLEDGVGTAWGGGDPSAWVREIAAGMATQGLSTRPREAWLF